MAERPKSEKERREERLQAALRENLKRRKAQARGRAETRKGRRNLTIPPELPPTRRSG